MLFNSGEFLIFFPIVLIICFCLPKKIRYLWLLASSYYFYMSWNVQYVMLILFSTLVTWLGGLILDKCEKAEWDETIRRKRKKIVVTVVLLLNLGVLAYFKYTNFIIENINNIISAFGGEAVLRPMDIVLPVGISFFTFQALSYLIDVYRNDIYAEKNLFRYALFVSFFPQLVAGPIERSKNLLKQLATPPTLKLENIREGFWLMVYGYFLKVVLADRIAIFVDSAYGAYEQFQGIYLIVASLLFAIQLYCDFYGYSVIAMGVAAMLGYRLIDNFNAPFLSTNIAGLWRRWHISLNTWFRDYLYIPLGGNKKGKAFQYINKIIVFFVSGLWHGADWTFVIWGMLNGIYQLIGEVLRPIRNKVVEIFGLDRSVFSHKLYQGVVTFLLFAFSGVFFRAATIKEALGVLKGMFSTFNPWILFDGRIYQCGLDKSNFMVMLIGIIILFISDYYKNKGTQVRKWIIAQEGWFRVVMAAGSILLILLLGIWGTGYDQAGFIYFQF